MPRLVENRLSVEQDDLAVLALFVALLGGAEAVEPNGSAVCEYIPALSLGSFHFFHSPFLDLVGVALNLGASLGGGLLSLLLGGLGAAVVLSVHIVSVEFHFF